MIALQITSMKNFMNHLLVADTFNPFLLEEATAQHGLHRDHRTGISTRTSIPRRNGVKTVSPWELQILEQNKRTVLRPDQGKTHSFVF